jgi:hypothetical protein
MGAYCYIANLSDKVRYWSGGKFGEDPFHYQSRALLDLIIGWENPLPNLREYLASIERRRGDQDAEKDQNECRLLQLPSELFEHVLGYLGNFEDTLILSFTCRKAMKMTAPWAMAVRDGLSQAIGPFSYPNDPWNGKRIIVSEEGLNRDPLVQHAQTAVVAAAKLRGEDESDPKVIELLRLVEDIRVPDECAEYRTNSSPEGEVPFRDTSVDAVRALGWGLKEYTSVFPTTRRLWGLPETADYEAFIKREDVILSMTIYGYGAEDEYWRRKRHSDASPVPERYAKLLEEKRQLQQRSEEEIKRYVANGDVTGKKMLEFFHRKPEQPAYRIINLDTLEHLDSTQVESAIPTAQLAVPRGRSGLSRRPFENFDAAYVLWAHLVYMPGHNELEYLGYEGPEVLGLGRWAGHRLRYQVLQNYWTEQDEPRTTNITLEMLPLAVATWNSRRG